MPSTTGYEAVAEVLLLSVGSIVPGPNDRKTFSSEGLEELARSIAANGLAQPITVRPIRMDGEELELFEVVAGERRFRAVQLLGWTEIPAMVRELTDEQASRIMLCENLARKDLNPMEVARAFYIRMKRFGWCVAEVAERSQIHTKTVKRRLLLLNLCDTAQQLVERGQLPASHAELMASLDTNRQVLALRLFQGTRPPTLVEFGAYCSDLLQAQSQEALWDLTELTMAQVEASSFKPGKAGAGVKTHPRIPRPKMPWAPIAEILEQYMADLHEVGEEEAALTIGTFYDEMVRSHGTNLPKVRLVPRALRAEKGTSEE